MTNEKKQLIINDLKSVSKEELAEILYSAYYDNKKEEIDLSNLDFTSYECNVNIGGMKVLVTLYQDKQIVINGSLFQGAQKVVNGNLFQNYQKVKGMLSQHNQEVKGTLYQHNQKVEGHLYQEKQTVRGVLHQDKQPEAMDIKK